MLQTGTTKQISFKVNVHGTSTTPSSVRVVLAATPELAFIARPGGDGYIADLEVPEDFPASVELRVEVVINNRLFVPIKKTIEIEQTLNHEEPKANPEPAPVEVPPSIVQKQEIEVEEKPAPIRQSILRQFEAEAIEAMVGQKIEAQIELGSLSRLAANRAFTSGMPRPTKTVSEKIQVRIGDINEMAKLMDEPPTKKEQVRKPQAKVKVVPNPAPKSAPVKLIKGNITYEK